MIQIPIYHIDTFTDHVFSGNPAAVCVLSTWLLDSDLHAIALENNLPVTTFLVKENDKYNIRWFTPEYELDICGHGTLAAGYVIFNYLETTWQEAELQSSTELLKIFRHGALMILDFPTKAIEVCSIPLLEQGLGILPKEIYQHKNERCLIVFNTEEQVKQIKPNIDILKKLVHRGIIITAPGNSVDFVSRTFYPQKTIHEDAVTGASHCLLIPYWSKRLNKNKLSAKQLSQRGGDIYGQYQGDRVLISGKAVIYMQGKMILNINLNNM